MRRLRLVLVGGGHAHALVLRMWAMKPRSDVELILISNASEAPYSGMLPGYIAGHYAREEMHIDLRRLARAAGAQFIRAAVAKIDPEAQRIYFAAGSAEGSGARPTLAYDRVSINVGSTPQLNMVPGAEKWSVPLKPVPRLLQRWEEVLAAPPGEILIVGGGAGGVEIALAMATRLKGKTRITVVQSSSELFPQAPARARRRITAILSRRGIRVLLERRATAVNEGNIVFADGSSLAFDALFWASEASAPEWFKASGLTLDAQGFLLVADTLASVGSPHVFAVGDCASVEGQKRPKSGVFAVRQGGPLWANLRRSLDGQPLESIKLQKNYLLLLGTEPGQALAIRGPWVKEGAWCWKLKEWIDRRFMEQFSRLPLSMGPSGSMTKGAEDEAATSMRCLGCGAKVGAHVLSEVLQAISRDFPDVLVGEGIEWGLAAREDVSLWQAPAGERVLQSIDYFPSLIDDPFDAGRLATVHAFNDIIAKGATPHSAMVLAVLPEAADHLQADQLYQLMAGVASQLRRLGAKLIGGHTAEGEKLAIGLSVNGLARSRLLRKDGGESGDQLILTKALGTGMIFAGAMQGLASGRWIDAALSSMLQTPSDLLLLLGQPSIHASTDITGFGLLGHLLEMLTPGRLSARLDRDRIPLLPRALTLAESGVFSSLYPANKRFEDQLIRGAIPQSLWSLWGDPQTAGGLLLAVSASAAAAVLAELHRMGLTDAAVIGSLGERGAQPIVF